MTDYFSFPRPDWVRRINYMGDSVGGSHHLISLDSNEMLQAAEEITGLQDFGDHWGTEWRDAYHRLVTAYDQGGLTTLGRLATRQEMIRTLSARLRLVDAHNQRPELAEVEIREPVFIIGQSRTGTSIIHELLNLDSNLRAPLAWEQMYPAAVENPNGHSSAQLAQCEQDLFADIVPEFAAVHELRADIPMECLLMMALEFSGGWAATTGNIDDWLVWRNGTDPKPPYEMHKRYLQLLQAENNNTQWLLKSPAHLMQLPSLFEVYPDAKIIHTHRDPVKTIASTISTVATSRFARSDQISTEASAFAVPIGFQMALEAGIEMREQGQIPKAQIADVLYHEFLQDEVLTLQAAYKQLGLRFDASHGERMRDYLSEKPQGKFGKHRYSLEEFGLNTADIRTNFQKYVDYYGIAENI